MSLFRTIPCILLTFSAIITPKSPSNPSPSSTAHSAPARTRGGGGEGKAGVCGQGYLPQHCRRGGLRTNPAKLTLYQDKYVPFSGYQIHVLFFSLYGKS